MQKQARHNILYLCELNTHQEHDPFVYEHVLALITSGSMDFYTGNEVILYPTGAFGLLKRNQLVKVTNRPDGEKPFTAVYIYLDQETLKKFSSEYGVKADKAYAGKPNLLLDLDPFMKGYFDSLLMHFARPEKLTPALGKIKTLEAIELLLRNPMLKNLLFDFSEPHKIDLEAYMNRHFSYNVPLTQFAKLTGRSLSTFKRDFFKIFHISPEKWIKKQRLEQAHYLIAKKHERPSDVYWKVGFDNFSHFSESFKEQFGYTPRQTKT